MGIVSFEISNYMFVWVGLYRSLDNLLRTASRRLSFMARNSRKLLCTPFGYCTGVHHPGCARMTSSSLSVSEMNARNPSAIFSVVQASCTPGDIRRME